MRVAIDGRQLRLTNLDKLLWPESGLTKGDYINYLVRMAPFILPHLARRPLVLTRYPDGWQGKWFYQKDIPDHAPDWVPTVGIWSADSQREIRYCLARDAATLAWLGNLAALEIHPWLSTVDHPDCPDLAVFDLDPSPPAGFDECVEIAFVIRDTLDHFGLRAYPKTSGATGLHIYLPIKPRYSYDQIASAVGRLADLLHQLRPDQTTRERTVAKRRGVYIDHLQNHRGKTLVGAYLPRPHPGAPVSTPVTWDELPQVRPEEFTLNTVPERVSKIGDLFIGILTDHQQIDQIL